MIPRELSCLAICLRLETLVEGLEGHPQHPAHQASLLPPSPDVLLDLRFPLFAEVGVSLRSLFPCPFAVAEEGLPVLGDLFPAIRTRFLAPSLNPLDQGARRSSPAEPGKLLASQAFADLLHLSTPSMHRCARLGKQGSDASPSRTTPP